MLICGHQAAAREINKSMSGKPAMFREREGKKVIELARKAGAKSVEFRYGEVTAIVRLDEADAPGVAPERNEWLTDDAPQA
jgi:hypothetical protein